MTRYDPRLTALLEEELASTRLLPLLADDAVTDVMVNEDGSVYVQTLGQGQQRLAEGRLAPDEIETLLATIASLHDTVITADEPVLEATLPFANARVEALLPPLVSSPVVALRKPPARLLTLDDLVANATLPADLADLLSGAFRARRTLVVAGGVGSGKTTLANALLADLLAHSPHERVVVLEEGARELHVEAANVVRLLTSERAGIGMSRLLRSALRLNPSRILIGEARGREALDFLRAANTGHPGSLLTTHANGALQALDRLDALAQEAGVPPQLARVAEAVDLVVYVAHTAGGRRRVLEVIEVEGPDATGRPVVRKLHPSPGSSPQPPHTPNPHDKEASPCASPTAPTSSPPSSPSSGRSSRSRRSPAATSPGTRRSTSSRRT